jgi:aerobic carbon-monoxide dehydrogenase medium subunit
MPTLPPFEIHRPTTVAEASALSADLGDTGVFYAGGTELLLLMKLGFARFDHLIDLKTVSELHRLDVVDGRLVIGGAVTHREIERSPAVRSGWPELVEMEQWVANIRVRSTGTLGGNLAFADPHSDPATFLLAAGAIVRVGAGETDRELAIDELIVGPYETTLAPGELLQTVEVPAVAPGTAMAHLRFAFHERPAATVSARVATRRGAIASARIAVGSVGVVPVLVPGAEALLDQDAAAIDEDVLREIAVAGAIASGPVTDANGSSEYKHALVATLIERVVREVAQRASQREETDA